MNGVAKKVLHDWQRGRIPYFAPPPMDDIDENSTTKHEKKGGKAEAVEEEEEIEEIALGEGVVQRFSNIPVKTQFEGEGEQANNKSDGEILLFLLFESSCVWNQS